MKIDGNNLVQNPCMRTGEQYGGGDTWVPETESILAESGRDKHNNI